MEVLYLLLQLPVLPIKLRKLNLQSLYFGMEISGTLLSRYYRCWVCSLFQLPVLTPKIDDLIAHTTDHLTCLMYMVDQGHYQPCEVPRMAHCRIRLTFGTSPSSTLDDKHSPQLDWLQSMLVMSPYGMRVSKPPPPLKRGQLVLRSPFDLIKNCIRF
ncbi:hypothetical protein B296_00039865 [Ensete ventricosum]|uniref:Uncharacterized protein n=1 Tax=Ensete ventricosum TaxID=4639 RepID=A0A426XLG6_ENSVE|nr:hypothetical protein B296_00039865 [Ensete ventricosum]